MTRRATTPAGRYAEYRAARPYTVADAVLFELAALLHSERCSGRKCPHRSDPTYSVVRDGDLAVRILDHLGVNDD